MQYTSIEPTVYGITIETMVTGTSRRTSLRHLQTTGASFVLTAVSETCSVVLSTERQSLINHP